MSFPRRDESRAGASRRAVSGARRALAYGAVAALVCVTVPRAAAADDGVNQCMSSYEAGQRLRREGDLVGAAAELLVCGGPACPVRMQGDCQRWLDDVERSTPAVVFRVRAASGAWLANVTASIDGAAPRRLDGRAIAMNPGEHVVVFERAGYRPLRTPVIVAEGEKLERRVITLEAMVASDLDDISVPPLEPGQVDPAALDGADLHDGSAAEAASAYRLQAGSDTPSERADGAEAPGSAAGQSLWGPLAFGAVAVAGGIGFAYFGVHAQSGEADLEQCTPNCSQARVDDVKDDFLRSNVSLGIGIAGLVGAGLWLLLDRPSPPDTGPHARQNRAPRSAFGFGPTPYWVARF
jgi:hypothetical protein